MDVQIDQQTSSNQHHRSSIAAWRDLKKVLRLMLVAALLLLTAATAPAFAADGKIDLLWLGQSAFKLTTVDGHVIVLDPYLILNPKTPAKYKQLDALGKVDLILVTHGHFDHFADAPALAKMNNAPVWGPAGLDQLMQTLEILPPELAPRMNKGGTITPFPNVHITEVHAEHSSELLWPDPVTKKPTTYPAGEPVGFIIQLENGFTIYDMGDTALFGDMRLIAERYKPDLLLVPIGGHYVLNPVDAAFATREFIKPRFVIPMHYGTTPQLAGTPEEFIKALGDSSTKVINLQPGQDATF
jgi:L-ascorbate metabolism protein UlaG (beta-lactamase superfamily)